MRSLSASTCCWTAARLDACAASSPADALVDDPTEGANPDCLATPARELGEVAQKHAKDSVAQHRAGDLGLRVDDCQAKLLLDRHELLDEIEGITVTGQTW